MTCQLVDENVAALLVCDAFVMQIAYSVSDRGPGALSSEERGGRVTPLYVYTHTFVDRTLYRFYRGAQGAGFWLLSTLITAGLMGVRTCVSTATANPHSFLWIHRTGLKDK